MSEYRITGMSCGHCENAVGEEVERIPGVRRAEVSAATGRLRVTADPEPDDDAVLAAVNEAGYVANRTGR